jgi:penicillin amidase
MLAVGALLAACTGEAPPPADFDALAEASLAQIDGTIDVPGLGTDVRVVRDEWGVPHIYAENTADLFFAQGWVQAQDRLWQMDMWRRVNEGRLSEILGPEGFEHDKLARLIMFRGPWEEEWTSYHPDGKRIFESFAAGVNAYIDHIGDNLPVEYKLTGLRPLRWTPEASTGRVATALPIGNARQELTLARQIAERGLAAVNGERRVNATNWLDIVVSEGVDYSIITPEVIEATTHFDAGFPMPALLPEYAAWPGAMASENLGAIETSPGSNNWVASGRLTATGQVLLANDPHRGVTNPSLRYLVHLSAPGYDVIGSTEPTIPGVAIGHNGRVGWGLTIVGTDQADVFIERLNPENLGQAMWQGAWYDLTQIVDTIPVKGEAPRVVVHRFSRHGPVFFVDSVNHVGYALRSTANEPGTGGYLGALRLAEVADCHGFIDAMEWYKAPTENMVCGDKDGNIAWLAAALTPRRSGGWYGRLPVPGTGSHAWDGFRSHTELPQEFNPARGWLGTSNHDIQPAGYRPPLFFKTGPYSRWDRQLQMFENASNLTADDFERMQHDAMHPYIADDRPFFTGWTSTDADVEWARALLEQWDGVYSKSSAAPAIHSFWRRALPDEARAAGTPPSRRQELNESAFRSALSEMGESQGEDRAQWRWGRIQRSEFPHWLVRAYDLPSVERNGGGGTIAATGATFREIIDFADLDNSRVTNTPGQSAQPGSPYYGNLLPLWGNEQYFPLLYTPAAVEARAAHTLTLRPGS